MFSYLLDYRSDSVRYIHVGKASAFPKRILANFRHAIGHELLTSDLHYKVYRRVVERWLGLLLRINDNAKI